MARISNRPNVVDLTGDDSDSDLDLDESSISPFHQDLLKKFKARSSIGAVKRQPNQQLQDALHRPGSSVPSAARDEPIPGSSLSSSVLNIINIPPTSAISRAPEVSLSNDASRKRNAEEAFKADQNPSHQRPATQAAPFSPFSAKIAKILRPKELKGRSGFDDLLSRAEASVTGRQDEREDISPPPSLVTNRQDTLPSATKSSRPPAPSPKVFSPPPLQQASIGSSIRIVSISDAVTSIQLPTNLGQTTNRPTFTSQAGPTTQSSSRQAQTTAVPGLTVFQARKPFASPFATPEAHPIYASQSSGQAGNTPAQSITSLPGASHGYFDSSILPTRQGHPFTEAELVILIYLREELNVNWTDMDRKMGRTTNCCATKYLRKVVGVKYRKNELRYRERAAVIKAVIATTATPTIEKVFRLLTDFVQSGSLPPGCSELYNAILETSPLDTTPEPSQKPDAVSVSISSVSVRVRERLRPGARTSEGDMNLKAMTRRFRETPDVLSDEASVFSDNVYDSSSDIEIHTLARKEYPEDSFVRRKKPYLGLNERRTLKSSLKNVDWEDDNWGGQSIHLDPEEDELAMLRQCANAVITSKDGVSISLQSAAKNASQAQIADIARRAKLLPQFRDRTRKSIQAMLTDAATGNLSRTPMRFRITPPLSPPSEKRISTRLLRRELGGAKTASRSIYQTVYDSLAPSRSWTGASGDVGTVAWSPDGRHFAAGSMCLVDPSSMQYNRPNNLLFGNTQHQTLYELPEHHRPREKPDEGANSSHSMHVSQDPRLFFTVSMVDFSRDGSHMFSVGYDNFLRSYEVGSSRCDQNWVVDYGAEVDVLATSRHLDLLATGSHDIESGIRIYGTHGQNKLLTTVGSSKARNFLDKKIYPSAVRWGIHNSVKNYLLAGFSPTAGDETNTTHGETCLWDVARQTPIAVNPSAGNIFDVAWSPRSARFATACTAYGQSVNKGTHSLVRICSPVDMDRWSNGCLELECPARDINDVILCPYDENYVAAGATNNEIYIWDIRRPNSLLQRFAHGEPLAELDPGMSQELADCGVRFCSWGENRERLHTGSSDGVVKVWDIFRSPQDSHIRDIASFNSGVMSGAFNHDFSSLLIGEVNGTINLLEVGADPPDLLKDLDTFHFEPAVAETHIDAGTPVINKESGIWIGKRARKARKIKFRPMAGFPRRQATQGMNYDGPYDSAPDAEQLRDAAALFQKKLKVEKDSQCENPLCKEYVGVTEEEAGDSGRAVDRIPEALRDAATSGMVGNEAKEGKMVPGMLRCSHCGGLARPRISDKEQEKSPLCERCGFSCFRCGGRVKVGLAVEKVGCARCELEWRIGALGYEVIRSSGCGKTSKKVPPVLQLDPFQHDVLSLRKEGKAEKSGLEDMGDLLYLVEDYYHGLWEDSPSSAL